MSAESIKKLAQLSTTQILKDQVQALENNDSVTVRRLYKEHGPDPQQVAYQMAVVVELVPLLALPGVKSEGQRKALVEGAKASFMAALNRVAFLAQKSRDAGLKDWCEQAQIAFADMTGSSFVGRASRPPPSNSSPRPPAEPVPTVGSINHDGHKVIIKGYMKQSEPVLIADLQQQSSVLIMDCMEAIFQLPASKITAVQIDKCISVGVVVEGDVIASLDVVNSRKCQVETSGHLPILNIDCCDGLTVHLLSVKSKDIQIVTSRSSELNIVHPEGWSRPKKTVKRTERRAIAQEQGEDNGDDNNNDNGEQEPEQREEDEEYEEYEVEEQVDDTEAELLTCEVAIPVQFRFHFDSTTCKLVTEPVEHI